MEYFTGTKLLDLVLKTDASRKCIDKRLQAGESMRDAKKYALIMVSAEHAAMGNKVLARNIDNAAANL